MSRKHIAFLVPAAHGHINPTLGVASELLARGYRVTYATEEGPLASLLRNLNFEVVAHDSTYSHEGFSSIEKRLELFDASRYLRSRLKALEVFTSDCPSLIFYDFGERPLAALLSAKIPGVQTIQSHPTFVHNDVFTATDWGDPIPPETKARHDAAVSAFLAEFGVDSSTLNDVPPWNVVFIPRFFQYAGNSFGNRYFFVGPSLAKRPDYGRWIPPKTGRRVVLISLGTVINASLDFFKACISSLRDINMHFVMSVGRGIDISALEPIPANFEIYSFVSHLDVLPYSSAYIGHGGMNSTMEAMWHGVPMLLSPRDKHQDVIARRVSSLHLGQILPDPSENLDSLRTSLLALLADEQIGQRAKQVSSELRTRDAVADVVAIIEERLRSDCDID